MTEPFDRDGFGRVRFDRETPAAPTRASTRRTRSSSLEAARLREGVEP